MNITPTPILICTQSFYSIGVQCDVLASIVSSAASAAYPSANRAHYAPFIVHGAILVQTLFWYNGATVSGNVDIGLYSIDGTRLVSTGSTVQSGTSVAQSVAVTSFILPPGAYFFAISCDNTTATFMRSNAGAQISRLLGLALQNTAFPLPATATFAATGGYSPVMGLSTRSFV